MSRVRGMEQLLSHRLEAGEDIFLGTCFRKAKIEATQLGHMIWNYRSGQVDRVQRKHNMPLKTPIRSYPCGEFWWIFNVFHLYIFMSPGVAREAAGDAQGGRRRDVPTAFGRGKRLEILSKWSSFGSQKGSERLNDEFSTFSELQTRIGPQFAEMAGQDEEAELFPVNST